MTSSSLPKPNKPSGWIAVDLDGTLAQYDERRGVEWIGPLIEPMLLRVQQWLQSDIEVRIFTARAGEQSLLPALHDWLAQAGLGQLTVTNQKDLDLLQIWDDRAVQVETNTAELLTSRQHIALMVSGWIGVELDGTLAHHVEGSQAGPIGPPIDKMLARVKQWRLAGMDIRLFSARASDPEQLPIMQNWLSIHQLADMKITCSKDFALSQFWDDRSIHVISNTGEYSGRLDSWVPPRKFSLSSNH